jgi:hypothetical protein
VAVLFYQELEPSLGITTIQLLFRGSLHVYDSTSDLNANQIGI